MIKTNAGNTLGGLPVATVLNWPGATPPVGWVLSYGQVLLQVDYPALYSAIGATYNTGGELGTQFRLPDLRGRVAAGRDNMGGSTAGRLTSGVSFLGTTLGGAGGAESIVLTTGQLPSHGANSGVSDTDSNTHNHTMPFTTSGGGSGLMTLHTGGVPSFIGYLSSNSGGFTSVTGDNPHSHPASTLTSEGNDEAHPNLQPTLFMNKIIKVV